MMEQHTSWRSSSSSIAGNGGKMIGKKHWSASTESVNQNFYRKKCTDDLKSFNTSIIKYRSDGNDVMLRSNEFLNSSSQSDGIDRDLIKMSYAVQKCAVNLSASPVGARNNNNNNNNPPPKYANSFSGRRSLRSPPQHDEYVDFGSCCHHSFIENHLPVVNARNGSAYNYNSSLISNKFSNSSPSVFYASTPTNANNNNNGYYKSRYYSSNKPRDRRKTGAVANTTDICRRVFGLMERFASRSRLFYIPPDPSELMQCNQFDMLNTHIWEVYAAKAQKEQTYLRKLEFWKHIYINIQKIILRYGLFLVGSTMSGLGLDSSDIDMCLVVRPGPYDPRTDALGHLQNICKLLEHCDFIKEPKVIMAKVPILKFRDASYGFEVDLNCNNSVGIRNTHLLNAYARLDWRVRPLVVIVKVWAQANGINDAKRMTINSYSLALMTIHYLQCGVSPPALPCLQAMYPERFGEHLEIQSLDLQDELPAFYSENQQSLGELFIGFLHYFSHFNYNQFAMSVREGALLTKDDCRYVRAPKNDALQWKLLCIEEPFDLTNTARCVYDVATFEHIKAVLRLSYDTLVKTKSLASIISPMALAGIAGSPCNGLN